MRGRMHAEEEEHKTVECTHGGEFSWRRVQTEKSTHGKEYTRRRVHTEKSTYGEEYTRRRVQGVHTEECTRRAYMEECT